MKLHPATKCRKEDWQVSPMTHWRWINDHGFPKPVKSTVSYTRMISCKTKLPTGSNVNSLNKKTRCTNEFGNNGYQVKAP